MKSEKPTVKLVGENGNVFNLLGICHRAARKAGWDEDEWNAFFAKATDGSYENALEVIQERFDVE